MGLDVVAIRQAPEPLLAGCVPHVEPDGSSVGRKDQQVHLHAQGGYGLLLELASRVALPGAAVAHQDELALDLLLSLDSRHGNPSRRVSTLFVFIYRPLSAVACGGLIVVIASKPTTTGFKLVILYSTQAPPHRQLR